MDRQKTPPIPQLAAWEAHLTAARAFVDAQPAAIDHSACTGPGCKAVSEALAWYYDGNRVFRQIAGYTRDRSWLDAAKKCRLYYRAYLNCPAIQHAVDGWRNFPHGLYLDAVEDKDPVSREDALTLARRGKFAQVRHREDIARWQRDPASVDLSREIAYAISAWHVARDLGDRECAGRDPYLDLAYYQLDVWRDYLQGYPNAPYPGEPTAKYQPFMFALSAESLIGVYRRKDTAKSDREKIRARLAALARLTDEKLYRPARHAFIANTGNPETHWPSMNLLIVPVYGWLWHETGEAYYREAGDRIFADGVVHGWPEVWGGKPFSQNYRWSFDYVAWRQQAPKRSR